MGYDNIRCAWKYWGVMLQDGIGSGYTDQMCARYRQNLLLQWTNVLIIVPSDPLERRAQDELIT